MNGKPVVMEHFSTVHTSFLLNFAFTNNITILTGVSASGKTLSFSMIRECMAVDEAVLCLNYLDCRRDIEELLRHTKGKLIVIDNADILLDEAARKYISLDGENQYLLIGRNPENLFATKENLFELVNKKVGEQTEFSIQPYL